MNTLRTLFSNIVGDSRLAGAGALFVNRHGVAEHTTQALANGAAAVLQPQDPALYAQLCAAFFGAVPQHLVAVTGTDGKTSVADFVRQLWGLAGHAAVSIGTLGAISNIDLANPLPLGHTTPDARDLQQALSHYAAAQVQHAVLEASSHGLAQHRLDGLRFNALIATSFGRDHLDYHHTVEAYAAAKSRLFSDLAAPNALCIVNADDAGACALVPPHLPTWRYGKNGDALVLQQLTPHAQGQTLQLLLQGTPVTIELPLIGDFQAYNALAALAAVAHTLQQSLALFAPLLSRLQPVCGRIEYVATTPAGASVYIDYAHTPNALQKALQALRPHTAGKLWVVFGCGGNRDAGKRPLMGAVAAKYADVGVITSDNPRDEDPASICSAITQGAPQALVLLNRAQAIAHALQHAAAHDVILLAGKGHERTQVLAQGVTLPFDERHIVAQYLAQGV